MSHLDSCRARLTSGIEPRKLHHLEHTPCGHVEVGEGGCAHMIRAES